MLGYVSLVESPTMQQEADAAADKMKRKASKQVRRSGTGDRGSGTWGPGAGAWPESVGRVIRYPFFFFLFLTRSGSLVLSRESCSWRSGEPDPVRWLRFPRLADSFTCTLWASPDPGCVLVLDAGAGTCLGSAIRSTALGCLVWPHGALKGAIRGERWSPCGLADAREAVSTGSAGPPPLGSRSDAYRA